MLLDSTPTERPDTAVPAAPGPRPAPDDHPRELPSDLGVLTGRARRDRGSALALVHLLLERDWSLSDVVDALDGRVSLTRRQVESLAAIRRPRTSATDVADRLVAARRSTVPAPAPRATH